MLTRLLSNSTLEEAKETVDDLALFGRPEDIKLIAKAASESQGWMKCTKAIEIPSAGCIVQVSTEKGDNVAEAVTFVPNVRILQDEDGNNYLSS